jgi:hypothetical protein
MNTKKIYALFLVVGMIVTACVKDDVFQGPPVISDLVLTPQVPAINQAVQVNIKVTDLNGVESVKLFYNTNNSPFSEVAMTGNGNIYTANIPGQASDITVSLYVMATNKAGLKTYFPEGAPTNTAAFTVGAPLIVMNEIYSRGTSDDPDWIEIYNDSDVEVNIGGYLVYDKGVLDNDKPKLSIPDSSIIPAKGFFVVVVDVEGGFGLSGSGEEVWLENAKGNIIDNVIFPALETTQSYGRNPDGTPNWEVLNTVTKGAPNSTSDPVGVILMNEIYSTGTVEDPDWIEIYNASDFEANIGGYKIYDSGGQTGPKPKKEIPAETVIPAKGWFVIVVDDGDESGFGLSSNGETVWLENAAGVVVDNVTFPALEETQSYGRFPDGDDNWQGLPTVTKGAANSDVPPSEKALIHYWHFNDQKEPSLPIESDFSINELSAAISYPGTGAGFMDYRTVRPQDPASNLNLRMGQEPDQGAVLRVRNPAEGRVLLVEAPSTGFEDLVVMFAITRSSDLAGEQQFFYSADNGNTWVTLGDIIAAPVVPDWDLITIDLSGYHEVNDNAGLQLKIEYSGEAIGGNSGNNRYDNFSVDGKPVR